MTEERFEDPRNLEDYEDLSALLKAFNRDYKNQFPQLSKSKAVKLCKENGIAIFSFAEQVTIRTRIFVPKGTSFASLCLKTLKEVDVPLKASTKVDASLKASTKEVDSPKVKGSKS